MPSAAVLILLAAAAVQVRLIAHCSMSMKMEKDMLGERRREKEGRAARLHTLTSTHEHSLPACGLLHQAAPKTFDDPRFRGYGINTCLDDAKSACGEAAASESIDRTTFGSIDRSNNIRIVQSPDADVPA